MSNKDSKRNDKDKEAGVSAKNGSVKRTSTERKQNELSAIRLEVGRDAGW